jgi:type IV secretion system protein VirD4
MDELKNKSYKQLLMGMVGIGYVFVLFYALHVGTVTATEQLPLLEALLKGLAHLKSAPFTIVFSGTTFLYIFILTIIFAGVVFYIRYDTMIRGPGEKNPMGSAKWNTDWKKYNKIYSDPPNSADNNGPNNMILTQNIFLNMDSRATRRNNNVLVVGGSGAGKSRFMVKPNLLQANCNYVITDPAGELLESTGKFLENQGYEVKVFNLVEMNKSDRYNPFAYIRDDVGVLMMINCLIKNTNPAGQSGGDPFWEKSETALLQALVFYLIKYRPKHQQNFTSVMKLLRAAEVDENDANKKSKLDKIFDEVAVRDPNSIALKQYLTFKMGAGKTLKSILISTSVRLTVFNMKQIENLTKEDSIDLGAMGEGKKALFVIIPAADSTYNFLVSMMYSQLFETLYFVAETKYDGKRLQRPVRFLLDEFANIGQIPEFTKKLATMRKYEISCTIILQNLAQIKTMYKDDWESIVGNCDSFLFLGGQEYSTLEYVSKELGKKTIETRSSGISEGKSKSSSKNRQKQGRELMTPDEIMRMDNTECILIIRGLYPFYDKKYEYTKHANYPLTGDADKSLRYINMKDNSEKATKEELEVYQSQYRAAQYAKVLNGPNPENVIISEPVNINSFITSLNIDDVNEIRSKIIVIGPDDMQQLKPSNKELSEQLVHEEQRKKKKKKKKKNTGSETGSETSPENNPNNNVTASATTNQTSTNTNNTTNTTNNAGFGDFDWGEDF